MNSAAQLVSLTVAGFIVSFAGRAPAQDAPQVIIVDQRTAESLKPYRASTFSALAFYGEKYLKPPPLVRLQEELSKRVTQPMSLVASEMRIADFFPTRLKAGGGMLMEGLVRSKTDWSFIKDLGMPPNEDAILGLFAGTANGREIKVAAFAPYEVSAFALRVDTQKEYKDAISSVYEQIAQKIIEQTNNAQTSQQETSTPAASQ